MADPPVLATNADVLARWIGEDPPEAAQIDVYLADATAMILREFPDLYTRLGQMTTDDPPVPAPGSVTAAEVTWVICQVVIRKFLNPRGVRTEATGPFSATFAGDVSGQLTLTSEERNILSGVMTSGTMQGAFTIDPTPVTTARTYIGGQGIGGLPETGSVNDPLWTGLVNDA